MACSSGVGIDVFSDLRNADDSSLSEDKKVLIQKNATLLAYQNRSEKDSDFIDISEDLIDYYYDVLVTVATSEAGSQFSVATDLLSFSHENLYSILAQPRSKAPFLKNWSDSNIKTRIFEIDAILSQKGFRISEIYTWEHVLSGKHFLIENETPKNTELIAQMLETTGYFKYAEVNYRTTVGDPGNITIKELNEEEPYLKVIYKDSYHTCTNGCNDNRYYNFIVYTDGQVEFAGNDSN